MDRTPSSTSIMADRAANAAHDYIHIREHKQNSIPQGVLDRVKIAAEANHVGNADYDLILDGENQEKKAKILDFESRKLITGSKFASKKLQRSQMAMNDIARRIASNHNETESKANTPLIETKIASRLIELEELSRDINKEISHVDALVAIKESYLHQLRTAKELLKRDDLDENGDEALRAAAIIILSKVPKRYNPDARNREPGETIGDVIARLEEEVGELQVSIAERRFEVDLESLLLQSKSGPIDVSKLDLQISGATKAFIDNLNLLKIPVIEADIKNIQRSVANRVKDMLQIDGTEPSINVITREIDPRSLKAGFIDYTNNGHGSGDDTKPKTSQVETGMANTKLVLKKVIIK